MRSAHIAMLLLALGCSKTPGRLIDDKLADAGPPNRYVAAALEGDIAEWSIADGGFSIDWTAVGVYGHVVATFTAAGTCTPPDPTFGHQVCRVATLTSPSPWGYPVIGDSYYVLELPGASLFAHPTPPDGGSSRYELHVGVARAPCGQATGTYGFLRLSAPGISRDLLAQLGFYSTDAGVPLSTDPWNYNLVVNGAYATGSSSDPVAVAVEDQSSDPHPMPLLSGSCADGIFSAAVPISEGQPSLWPTIRGAFSADGLVAVGFPPVTMEGTTERGAAMAGARTNGGATLTDLLGKSFVFLFFVPGGGRALMMTATIDGNGALTWTSSLNVPQFADGGFTLGSVRPISDPTLGNYFAASGLVKRDSSTTTDGGAQLYAPLDGGSPLLPPPASLGGAFTVVDGTNRLTTGAGNGDVLFFVAQRVQGGKIVLVGAMGGANTDAGATRCFASAATEAGLYLNRQFYCSDGALVGFSR